MKKKYIKLLRLVLFAVIFVVIVNQVDFFLLRKSLTNISVIWLFPAFFFYLTRYVIQGIRWHLAAKAHHQLMSAKKAIRSQLEIVFLEIAFPLPDSEDGLKIAYMHTQKISLSTSIAIVLYDRVIGITIILLLLPLSFLFCAKNVLPIGLQQSWIPFILMSTILPLTIYHRHIISKLLFLLHKYFPEKMNWVVEIQNELQKKISLLLISTSLLLTFLHALCGAATAWVFVLSLQGQVPFLLLLAGIPLYYLSAILPLSIQGLGLYESTLILILQQAINIEMALTVGILHFFFHLLTIVYGGILYLSNADKENLENIFINLSRKLINTGKKSEK